MNKILPLMVCAAALFGCRTHLVTPDESWADYGRYYSPSGVAGVDVATPQLPAEIKEVDSKQTSSAVAALQTQGYVLLGKFLIADGTEISRAAVAALAQKLNAGAVVWSAANTVENSVQSNPATGIVGVDVTQSARMVAPRSDATWAEQVLVRKHEIWMLGKKGK